jgi:hypothetical protein
MDHLVEGKRPGPIGYLQLLDRTVARNVPGSRGRQDFHVCCNFLLHLTVGTTQPRFAGLPMTADPSIEQLSRRTVMPRPGEEEQIASFIVLQGEADAGLCAIRHEVRDLG